MSTIVAPLSLTLDEFLALPEGNMDREIIRGQVREQPMTYRNQQHSLIDCKLSYFLTQWVLSQPEPRGYAFSGDVGCVLREDPPTVVGIDVAYFGRDVAPNPARSTGLIHGIPLLAIEVLSPSNRTEDIGEKVEEYLAVKVAVTWVVDPRFRTVTVYRLDAEPELFNATQQLTAEPHLPGFSVPVAALFE